MMAKRRPMLNAPGESAADSRDPQNWGEADALPLGRMRANRSLIDDWRNQGNLHPAVEAAAYEIESVYRAMACGLWTKTGAYGERISGTVERDWPARIAIAYRDRYGPWVDEMTMLARKGSPVQATVLAAIVEGHSLREIDRARKWRKGTASGQTKFGLWRYAVIAKWVEERVMKEICET